jgi:hypothetical protein
MTPLLSGQILHALIVMVLNGALLSWLTLVWYRRSIRRLMAARASSGERRDGADEVLQFDPGTTDVSPLPVEPASPVTRVPDLEFSVFTSGSQTPAPRIRHDLGTRRVVLAYGLGALLWSTVISAMHVVPGGDRRPVVWVAHLLVNSWPIVPTMVLVLARDRASAIKWATGYLVGILVAFALFTVASQALRGSIDDAVLTNPYWLIRLLGVTIWLPLLILLPALWRRARAVVPLAMAAVLLFAVASLVFREALLVAFDQRDLRSLLLQASVWSSPGIVYYGSFMLVALPVGWIAWRLVRGLASGFERRRFSDVQIVADCWWAIVTVVEISTLTITLGAWALPAGLAAFVAYRLGVEFALRGLRPRRSEGASQKLTLLRVFGFQARTETLFDRVAQKWRLRGPVQLIAGVDLAMRTTDCGDVLTFLEGRLADRRLDDDPDPDGRFRVNELYCHDDTWRPTLQALLDRSDVVVADLRSFGPQNAGCRFELEELLRRVPADRVAIVHDGTTDLDLLRQLLNESWNTLRLEGRTTRPGRVTLVPVERGQIAGLMQWLEPLSRATS